MRKHNGNDDWNESLTSTFCKKIKNQKIVIFGAATAGEFVAEVCRNKFKNTVLFFIDNSLKKQNTSILLNGKAYKVYSPEDAMKLIDENTVIIISALSYEAIYNQLLSYNIGEDKIAPFCIEHNNENISKLHTSFNSDISLYYWEPFFSSNFGDTLSAILIPKLFNCNVGKTDRHKCNLISIGSLLDIFTNKDKLFHNEISVWGSGFIKPSIVDNEKFYCKMNFYAVRGNLSKQRVCKITGDNDDLAVGDPGLLVSRCFKNSIQKKYKFGLIPHYIDYYSEYVKRIINKYDDVLLIDVTEKPEDIIDKICSCEAVISSSLHGLVVSDSFDIPNLWVKFSDSLTDYKFSDYYSTFNLPDKINAFNLYEKDLPDNLYSYIKENYMLSAQKVNDIQNDLYAAFPSSS